MATAVTNGDDSKTTEQILLEEATAIHGEEKVKSVSADNLYCTLNNLNSAALCLSGGGIRSAAFALGVIQALATHPRAEGKGSAAASAEESLLARFHYLSTVSGGGYIGGWLSAGIARTSFADMWRKLTRREPTPEDEAAQIAWLRAYSNYLTPKLGLTSADTWAAVALYFRNLLLNWLIVAPVLCAALIAIKLVAVGTFALSGFSWWCVVGLFSFGAVLQIWALRFALLHRPSRPMSRKIASADDSVKTETIAETANRGERRTDERRQAIGRGADQSRYVRHDLLPSVVAAFAIILAFEPDVTNELFELPLWKLTSSGLVIGNLLYATAWLVAWPWPRREGNRGAVYWAKDFCMWTIAGGVYGAIVGFGIFLFTFELEVLIGGIKVTDPTKDTLLLLIYGVPWIISAQLTAEMIFVGLTSGQHNSDADREWFGRSTGWFAATAFAWTVVTFLALVGADIAFVWYAEIDSYLGKATGGLVSLVAGGVTAFLGKNSATPANSKGKGSSWTDIALVVSTSIFVIGLVVLFSALIDNLLLDHSVLQSPLIGGPVLSEVTTKYVDGVAMKTGGVPIVNDGMPLSRRVDLMWLLIGLAIASIIGWLASKFVNINRFSLHALYRNRLIRAFLGATNPGRNPDMFTGFDERDNPPMTALWPEGRQTKRLFHIVNIALNMVSSHRLAWQERKAESFTVSPFHCGSAYKAYRPSSRYAEGLTLGTAMAISGAAASPNMGYHSSPMVTLLLALFNVRLGWWLGNPGKEGNETYTSQGPTTAIKPLFDEIFGQSTDQNPYIYLSDGGHFENLGLYEMVRRRCRFIVVSDAGCDPKYEFEDLGNAVRKIWLDLGVCIHFRGIGDLKTRAADDLDPCCGENKQQDGKKEMAEPPFYALGIIDYPNADGAGAPGLILYVKAGYHRDRIFNAGVRNYAAANAAFPHQPTGDQFFSESQFESYRALGFEVMDDLLRRTIVGLANPSSPQLDELVERWRKDFDANPLP